MKTLTIISALSLALSITGVNAGFAKQNVKVDNGANPTARVKYMVTVHLNAITPMCNNYLIEITDASGRQVAPAQLFVPGNEFYAFNEQTRQSVGIRIARMVVLPRGGPEHFVCEQELFTPPAVRLLNFNDRSTYSFDLYPSPGQQPK